MTTADSLTTQAALDAETNLRVQGDSRLANFVGKQLLDGIPDPNLPIYSSHGALINLSDNDSLELSIWKLDNSKQKNLIFQDNGAVIITGPAHANFGDGNNDGFLLSLDGAGVKIQLDALGKHWTGAAADLLVEEDITSAGDFVEFAENRFATGVDVDKTTIGHISATWQVISTVSLRGRKVKVGPNP